VRAMAGAVWCRYGLSVLIGRARPPRQDWAYPASGLFVSVWAFLGCGGRGRGHRLAGCTSSRFACRSLGCGVGTGHRVRSSGRPDTGVSGHALAHRRDRRLGVRRGVAGPGSVGSRPSRRSEAGCGPWRRLRRRSRRSEQPEQHYPDDAAVNAEHGERMSGHVFEQPGNRDVGHDEGHDGADEQR
jgi:hypothetical protein